MQRPAGLPDFGAIVDLLRALPQIAEHLAEIRQGVESMDAEMKAMRAGVENIGAGVIELRAGVEGKLADVEARVAPMTDDVRLMRISVEDLGEHLLELQRSLSPLRRTVERLGFRRTRQDRLEDEISPAGEAAE